MTHVCHIHKKLSEMAIITMCDFSPYHHALPHWKYMLRCCSRYPIIVTPCQEFYSNTQNMLPTTCFNVYKIIYHFTVHVRRTFEEKITCSLYSIVKPENSNENFYSQKEIALMETSTYDFHKYRSQIFTCHMFELLALSTVKNNTMKPSDTKVHFKMYRVSIIIQSVHQLVLQTK